VTGPAVVRALLDEPAPDPLPGQTTVDDPQPVVPAGDPEPLFHLTDGTPTKEIQR